MVSVWGELKRRNVVKVAVAYAVVGWLLIEIAATILPIFEAPQWALQTITFAIILGFPLALVLSWVFDLTPSGVERTQPGAQSGSMARVAGRKLDLAIIGALILALGFVVNNYVLDRPLTGPVPLEDRPSVAALPFSNESAEEENAEFIANGLHDELLTQLAKIGSLKVISRTSVMAYEDSPKAIREIGRELDVASILEGRVQRAGDMIRVNVQLIDAETDEHLWADNYDRELTAENIFAIQSDMATAIAQALEVTLLPEEVARLNEVPTQSTRAWEFYITGNDYARDPDERTNMPLAVQQYERAIEEDPDFALAWAGLASARSQLEFYGLGGPDSLGLAVEAVQRAFELSPDSPESYLARADYHYFGLNDWVSALADVALAERTIPGDPRVLSRRAGALRRLGRWAESIASRDRALELDPLNIDSLENQGESYLFLRAYSDAERLYDRALEIAPDTAVVFFYKLLVPLYRDGDISALKAAAESPPIELGRVQQQMGWTAAIYGRDYETALRYLEGGNFGDFFGTPMASYYGVTHQLAGEVALARNYFQTAREEIEEALETASDGLRLVLPLAEALAGLGESEDAVRVAQETMELWPVSRDAFVGSILRVEAVLRVLVPAGHYDEAIEELDTYLDGLGHWSIEGLRADPRLAPIRGDSRFQALIDKYSR